MGCSASSSAATDLVESPSRLDHRLKNILTNPFRQKDAGKVDSFSKQSKKDFIRRAFQRNLITRSEMSSEVISFAGMETLIESMIYKRFGDGELLFLQGERSSEQLYIIISGKFIVSDAQAIRRTMTKGGIVDEIAFFSGIPRAFFVTAGGRSAAAYVLEKSSLNQVLRREKINKTLQSIEILAPLSDAQRIKLQEKSIVMTYAAGDLIVRECERIDYFGIIISGNVVVAGILDMSSADDDNHNSFDGQTADASYTNNTINSSKKNRKKNKKEDKKRIEDERGGGNNNSNSNSSGSGRGVRHTNSTTSTNNNESPSAGEGDYFGDDSLIFDRGEGGTLKAISKVTILRVNQEVFFDDSIFGEVRKLLETAAAAREESMDSSTTASDHDNSKVIVVPAAAPSSSSSSSSAKSKGGSSSSSASQLAAAEALPVPQASSSASKRPPPILSAPSPSSSSPSSSTNTKTRMVKLKPSRIRTLIALKKREEDRYRTTVIEARQKSEIGGFTTRCMLSYPIDDETEFWMIEEEKPTSLIGLSTSVWKPLDDLGHFLYSYMTI